MVFHDPAFVSEALDENGPLWRRINTAAAWLLFTVTLLATTLANGGVSPPPVTVLVIGDSLSAGYGLNRDGGFPAQLERALTAQGFAVRVRDGGVSGETTSGGRARLTWMLGGPPSQHPDAVILQLGANDALRGFDPDLTYANLSAMLSELKERRLPVLLVGMRAPLNLGEEYRKRFDGIYPRLAEAYDVALYPFFLEGVAAVPAFNQADGIHPNAEGVAEIVRRITPAVAALVATAADRMPAHAVP